MTEEKFNPKDGVWTNGGLLAFKYKKKGWCLARSEVESMLPSTDRLSSNAGWDWDSDDTKNYAKEFILPSHFIFND